MALQSVVAIAILSVGIAGGAALWKEHERRDAMISQRIAAERAATMEERRAERRIELERARAGRDRRRAAVERCMRDRERAWKRARRAGHWKRPRDPLSCRRLEG